MRTQKRTNEMPGVQMRCIPRVELTTLTSALKSAWALTAANVKTNAKATRLLMFRHPRNPELPLERSESVEIDRSDDVHDGQLPWLGGDDDQAGDRVASRECVDPHVLSHPALHRDDALPFRPELRPDAIGDRAVIRTLGVEFIAADVNAVDLADELANILFLFVSRKKFRREAEHRPVERHLDGLRCFLGE